VFNNQPQFKANGTIAPSRLIKIDTTGDGLALQAGAGDKCLGISQSGMKRAPGLPGSDTAIAAEAGDPVQVYALGDVAMLTLGGTVARGDYLKSDATGRGVTASSGDEVGAVALQSGTVGTLSLVQVLNRKA